MSRKKSKAARRRSMRLVLILILLAAAVIGFLTVFRLRTVYVRGNLHNAPEEVTALLLERPIAENTVLARLMNANRKIEDPGFIDSINVQILGRDTVRVQVNERVFVGCVAAGAYFWYFDSAGKVMARAKERTEGEHVPLVEGGGIEAGKIELGNYLTVRNTKMFSCIWRTMTVRRKASSLTRSRSAQAICVSAGKLPVHGGFPEAVFTNTDKIEKILD